ncbi:hypothetical protein Ancab_025467 [Ancistrocladus abbreviatus]
MSIESVVSAVIQRIGVLLYEEIKFLTDVEGEVNNLSMELKAMQCYLRDAEARQENFDQVDRIKVREIIKIAYDAEDVIESFILNCEYRSMRKESHLWKYGVTKLNLPDNPTETGSTSMISCPRAFPYSDIDEHVVGLRKHIKDMVDLLTREHGLLSLLVIAGMGGLGKTTLARKLYNHESVKFYFQCQAWVCISQAWATSQILSEISRQFGISSNVESGNIDKLVHEVHSFLEDKLYLIVLDDVWQKEETCKVQTLWGISAKSWRVKDLEQLSHLRKLEVTEIASMEELESVWKCPSITSDCVHKLSLQVKDEMELSSLGPISHSHNLSSLRLWGSLQQLPLDCGGFPCNLTKLILEYSKLSQYPMPFLGSNLSYLKYLRLGWGAYTGSEMVCKENSFLVLEELYLEILFNLQSLKVENGALPQLKLRSGAGATQWK